jgi:4-amino-4-deoxy-L-arabinose transferase-like glycosyltransferase
VQVKDVREKEWLRWGSNAFAAPVGLFVILVILGFGIRIGYGVVRYRSSVANLTGNPFVNSWDYDGLEHVLIARAMLSRKGYIIDDAPVGPGKHIRYAGQEALFKAPLYEFFLAGVFAVSGFSFKLFFPLQSMLGGLLSGLIGLITLRVFRSPGTAWFAGIAAATHPILVNSASQPYNENLFFCLFAASIWAFLVWFQSQRLRWALFCGAMIGLCMLTRESGIILLVAMGVVLVAAPRTLRTWMGYSVIGLMTVAVVAPWTIRNYVRFGILVPVASITGTDFLLGNNDCIASEGFFVPYWAEGPCPWVDAQRRVQPEDQETGSRVPVAVRSDRASRRITMKFIEDHPGVYAKLAVRRFWTTLLPYDPRGNQRLHERVVLCGYWLLLFPAGIAGMALGLRRIDPGRALLALLIILNLLSITAVLYWSDLRFRIGIDLLLGCFAGWSYVEFLARRVQERTGSLVEKATQVTG